MFYFLLAPALTTLWPLLLWSVYLPAADQNWSSEMTQYEKAQKVITEIITFDPDRLDLADAKAASAEFDYAAAVERTASLYGIPPTSYKLSSSMIITSAGQKSQSARLSLKAVSVTQFANFISNIQLRWSNLQCTRLKLTKKKDSPDSWDADIDFKYYF